MDFLSHKEPLSKFLNTTGENQGADFSALDDAMHFNKVYWTKDQIQGQEDWEWEYCEMHDENREWRMYREWEQRMKMYRAVEGFGKNSWGKMRHWEIYSGSLI